MDTTSSGNRDIRIAKASELYNSGMTPTQISKELGVIRATVYKWLKEAGHKFSPVPISQERKDAVRALYDRGVSISQISRDCEVSRTTIYEWKKEWKKERNDGIEGD